MSPTRPASHRLLSPLLAGLLLAGLPLWSSAQTVSVLYKRDSEQSIVRTDTAAQAALVGIERELIERGAELIQPDAKTYAILDKAPGTIVTFAADAGLSLLIDAVKTVRPNPGTDNAFAEVRLRARLFQGRKILASLTGNGQIGFRLGSEDKAFEAAADRAARQLVNPLWAKLEDAPKIAAAAKLDIEPTQVVSAPLAKPANKWALLVGISDFSQVRKQNPRVEVADLQGVKGDVALIRKTLVDLGVPDRQVKVLSDKEATTTALRNALRELAAKTGPDDLVVFYLASHGMPKQEGISGFGYPVTYDTRFLDKASIIDFEEIQGQLKALPARRVLWLADTCHSGGAALGLPVVEISTRSVKLKPTHGLSSRAATMGVEEKEFAVLTSAREDQVALEDGENGLFTLKLVEGLKKTGGREPIYKVYKEHVEGQVPARSREIDPGYAQQPGFARAGRGDAIAF